MRHAIVRISNEERFLTPSQAAGILHISLSTLKKLIYQEKIKTFKTPGGHHRILKSELFNAGKQESSSRRKAGLPNVSRTEKTVFEMIQAFSEIIDCRRTYCPGHSASVSRISAVIAEILGFSRNRIQRVMKAAFLHDIGLNVLPDRIVNKRGMMSPAEIRNIRRHPVRGASLLSGVSVFSDLLPIIAQHHERPDGTGYPHRLRNTSICLEAKIIAVAEAFDCMTAPDSYKKTLSFDAASAQIAAGVGTQFDRGVAAAFLENPAAFGAVPGSV